MMLLKSRISILVMFSVLVLSSASVRAQDYAVFHGAWIHAGFIQALKASSSVAVAMDSVQDGHPLWVEIDSTNGEGHIKLAFDFGEEQHWLLRRTQVHGSELQWVIGTDESPEWLVTTDASTKTFIALYDVSAYNGQPIVLGKLPAPRQEAAFLLERIVNASVLYGAYRDQNDQRYRFGVDMTGEWKGASIATHVDVDPLTHGVILTVMHPTNKSQTFRAERIGSALSLTDSSGNVLALEAE